MDVNENKLEYFVQEVQRVRREANVQVENEPINDMMKVYKSGSSGKEVGSMARVLWKSCTEECDA